MNRADGAVVGVARGEQGPLERFQKFLHKGSPRAVVESVSWTPITASANDSSEEFDDFEIRRE